MGGGHPLWLVQSAAAVLRGASTSAADTGGPAGPRQGWGGGKGRGPGMGGRISHSITLSLTLDQVRGLPANHCPPPTWGVGEQNEVMQKEREDKGNRGDPHKTARGGGAW
jgi:hypothetical protein